MKRIMDAVQQKPWLGWILFLGTAALVFIIGWLGASIMERRGEALLNQQVLRPIAQWEPRNEVWGQNWPREFETYKATRDISFRSKYAGSAPIDILERDPNLVVLWAGYAFSREYNQARGHAWAIQDIRSTLRTDVPQPGTCWTCKSTDVPRLMSQMGPEKFYHAKWADLGSQVINPIGCQDCHDPRTMNLRITRPALVEALQRRGEDVSRAGLQDMRSLVCAQCHVEYYFKGEGKYLTFPWDKGFSADDMEKYYDENQHVDWVHALSRTPMLKTQHPDYELWRTGIHADRKVACADCHMPYRSEGGVKFTDHHVRSPLANIANSCGVCHRESEATLRRNVEERQDRIRELLDLVESALVRAHLEARDAWDAGAKPEEMNPALQAIRHAQWRWDWVAAANGMGFHAPLECARTLGTALNKASEARMLLARIRAAHGRSAEFTLPDLSTKAKAQAFIGLDMGQLKASKARFIRNTLPTWDAEASHRQGSLPSY